MDLLKECNNKTLYVLRGGWTVPGIAKKVQR